MFRRKSLRIFFLSLLTCVIFAMFLAAYYAFGFERGTLRFKNNESVNLIVTSCSLFMYDYSMISELSLDTNFLGIKSIPSSLDSDEYAFLQFVYPDAPANSKDSTFSESEESGIRKLEFINEFDHDSCEIAIYFYKPTTFTFFNIDCGDSKQCNIVINSANFAATSMDIKGYNVQMNAPELTATTFTYLSALGHVEIPFFKFTTASIITREGDIAVQSPSSIALTSYQLDPYICLSAS